jgi:hypothetical protein
VALETTAAGSLFFGNDEGSMWGTSIDPLPGFVIGRGHTIEIVDGRQV